MSQNLVPFASRALSLWLGLALLLGCPAWAQPEPALRSAVDELVNSYLQVGPSKKEVPDGVAQDYWNRVQTVAIPEFLSQPELNKGDWNKIWRPIQEALEPGGFSGLAPLEVISLWEETRSAPPRFSRLLAKRGLLDLKEPEDRQRGKELRALIGPATARVAPMRASIRFEKGGWKYTGTANMAAGRRLVRVALRGSQPCEVSGRARTVNLALKGRLFDNPGSEKGFKVQVLQSKFQTQACELNLISRINSVAELASGGEARIAGSLTLNLRDTAVGGRLQLDLVSRQPGKPLLTGRAIYKLRGQVGEGGVLTAKLVPVSTAGSRELRAGLGEGGTVSGTIKVRQGKGKFELPICKAPLNWRATSGEARR